MTTSFTQKNSLFFQYLDYFARKLEAPILGNLIKVPPQIGTGSIKWHLLEKGFGLRYYNFRPDRDIEYNLFTPEESGSVYKLIYVLKKEAIHLVDTMNDKNIFLHFAPSQKKLVIRRGEDVCRLVLIFNKKWLEKNHFSASMKMNQLITALINTNRPAVITEELDRKNFYIIKQLVDGMDHLSFPPMRIKTSGFLLLGNFLDKITADYKSKVVPDISYRFKEIIEVEQKLAKYIHNLSSPLPKIEDIAYEFNMSVSTLRRHFKVVYGKNIYEYYQKKRMLWAKSQIENGNGNISEIARKLGFMKPNNFSKAFRKEFRMLPSQMKHLS
jgi:AraC-like DNA-binding protein